MNLFGHDVTGDTLLAAAAIIIAAWSAWTSHRAFKLAKGASKPAVSAHIHQVTEEPSWWRVHITVTNRSDHPLTAESLRVIWPRRAKLLTKHEVACLDGFGNEVIREELTVESAARQIGMRLSVARAGTLPPQTPSGRSILFSPSETGHEDAFLWLGQRGARFVWLRVRIASSAGIGTRRNYSIFRRI